MNDDRESSLLGSLNAVNTFHPLHHALNDAYTQIEGLCYLQLGANLYLDQSFIITILRWTLLTNFIPPTAQATHRIPVIIFVNVGCALIHLLSSAPQPVSNATRGYLSGGLIIDHVGEFAASSKSKLILLDILSLSLHLLMLLVGRQKQKIEDGKKPHPEPEQDLDAEEQGVRRAEESVQMMENGDIEMQNLLSSEPQDKDEGKDEVIPTIKVKFLGDMKEVMATNSVPNVAEGSSNEAIARELIRRVTAARTV